MLIPISAAGLPSVGTRPDTPTPPNSAPRAIGAGTRAKEAGSEGAPASTDGKGHRRQAGERQRDALELVHVRGSFRFEVDVLVLVPAGTPLGACSEHERGERRSGVEQPTPRDVRDPG